VHFACRVSRIWFDVAKICGYLQKQYAADKEQWELVEKKAYTWIKKETKKLGVADTVDWQALAIQLAA
jgi:hypothetical protein